MTDQPAHNAPTHDAPTHDAPTDNAPRDFWSRRKARVLAEQEAERKALEAKRVEEEQRALEEKTDAEILQELELPDPDLMAEGDDFSAFMKKAVPDRIRRRALRRLWLSNSVLANVDGLVDYGEDFTDAATVIENMQTAYQVGKGMTKHVEVMEAEAAAKEAEEAKAEGAVGDDTANDDETNDDQASKEPISEEPISEEPIWEGEVAAVSQDGASSEGLALPADAQVHVLTTSSTSVDETDALYRPTKRRMKFAYQNRLREEGLSQEAPLKEDFV